MPSILMWKVNQLPTNIQLLWFSSAILLCFWQFPIPNSISQMGKFRNHFQRKQQLVFTWVHTSTIMLFQTDNKIISNLSINAHDMLWSTITMINMCYTFGFDKLTNSTLIDYLICNTYSLQNSKYMLHLWPFCENCFIFWCISGHCFCWLNDHNAKQMRITNNYEGDLRSDLRWSQYHHDHQQRQSNCNYAHYLFENKTSITTQWLMMVCPQTEIIYRDFAVKQWNLQYKTNVMTDQPAIWNHIKSSQV